MDEIKKQEIIDKWDESGVLGHLGYSKSDTLASLLESHAKDFYLETWNTPSYFEDALIPDPLRTRSGGVGLLPTAMSVAAKTVALDLVSVKPFTGVGFNYDNYKKKPKLPRKKKKHVIRTIGREAYTKWINRQEWDKPYRRCNTVPIKRERGLLSHVDLKFDYEDY